MLLILEKSIPHPYPKRLPSAARMIFTFATVISDQVLFASDGLSQAIAYYRQLLMTTHRATNGQTLSLPMNYGFWLYVAVVSSTHASFIVSSNSMYALREQQRFLKPVLTIVVLVILLLCLMSAGYQSFLYIQLQGGTVMEIRNVLRSCGITLTVLLYMIGSILLHLGHWGLTPSEKENHVLQQRSAADIVAVSHDSLQKESEAWLQDQLDQCFVFVQLYTNLNYIPGRRKLQGVVIGQDGTPFQKQEKPNQERFRTKAGQLRPSAKRHEDKKLSVLPIPSKLAIRKEKLSAHGQGEDQSETLKNPHKKLLAAVTWIDVAVLLQQHRGEVLYYVGDHHWTTWGAVVASDAWCVAEKNERKTDYEVYTVNDQFYGTLVDASDYYRDKRDHVNIHVPEKSQEPVITYVQEQRRTATVFKRDKVAFANPYGIFFGGSHSLMQLDTAQSGKWLFVAKDSYASCFLPFPVPRYKSVTVINLRYYYDDLDKLTEEQGVQEILFLYNVNIFSNDDSLNKILKREVK